MKAYYKKIIAAQRSAAPTFLKANLIHMLINLKSWDGRIYRHKVVREQLRWVMKGQKTWDGDVKAWFWNNHRPYVTELSGIYPKVGSGNPKEDEQLLPF